MKHVFLDTNIVIEVGKPPYGPEFVRVLDLIEAEQISMLTTNLTVAEVIRYHMRRDFNEMKSICNPKLRAMVAETIDEKFPTITEKQLRVALKEKYRRLVNDMFVEMDTKLLKISEVNTNKVFADYLNERGLFENGKGKKHQFPDAFIFERLKDEVSQNEPIIIVSKDKDFEQPANDHKHISLVKSLPDLFGELGLKLEDPEIEHYLAQNYDEITKLVNDELSNWGLEGDIEDSEITDTEVISVEILDTIAFKSADKGGPILIVGQFCVLTIVNFTCPDESTSMYDPEERRRIYLDTVYGDIETELIIDVSLSIAVDDKGNPIEIKALEFRNDSFSNIQLNPDVHY